MTVRGKLLLGYSKMHVTGLEGTLHTKTDWASSAQAPFADMQGSNAGYYSYQTHTVFDAAHISMGEQEQSSWLEGKYYTSVPWPGDL
jgi:hypothetical protein